MNTLLHDFLSDTRTRMLFAFILADLITGVAASLRARSFDWARLGDFYYTSVVPFVLGYLLIYAVTVFGLDTLLGPVLSELAATLGVGPAILALTASIAQNLAAFRAQVPQEVVKERKAKVY